MFNFFETLAELFDAVSLHRIWLIGLTLSIVILALAILLLTWKHLTKSLKIDDLIHDTRKLKNDHEKEIESLKTEIRVLEAKLQAYNEKKTKL